LYYRSVRRGWFLEAVMSKWEYKPIPLERIGTKEDFGFSWTYGPWEMRTEKGKQPLEAGLKDLGAEGWELAGVLPTDLWAEAGRGGSSSAGVRTISATLLFKRQLSS
jgi:hypothetical protein